MEIQIFEKASGEKRKIFSPEMKQWQIIFGGGDAE